MMDGQLAERTAPRIRMNGRVRRWLEGVLASAVIVAATGCGAGDAADGDAFVVRDSAGIAIAENRGDGVWEEGDAWRLSAEPAVRIGALNGLAEYQLYDVRDAVRLSDGRIVVSNAGTDQLRFYNAEGQHVRSVGGDGDGPGEFRELANLAVLPGDTLYAWDFSAERLSIFGPRGDFIESVNLSGIREVLGVQMVGAFDRGAILLDGGFNIGAALETTGTRIVRDTVGFLRVDRTGTVLDTLGSFPGNEQVSVVQGTDSRFVRMRSLPFGREALLRVRDSRAYVGVTGRWEIGVYTPDGQLERLIRLDRSRVPVTSDDIADYKESALAGIEDQNERRQRQSMLEAITFPDRFPAFSDFHVDSDGDVWVESYARPDHDGPTSSLVFDPEGRLLGSVQIPSSLRIDQIGSDYLLGVTENDLGIKQVRLYEIIKPAQAE